MKVTEILQQIKPYVLGWIETGGVEGGYAPSPHELDGAHHVGTLTSSQYPDALLRDGSRSLTGNLSVGAGITIDGVDLGAFKTSYDSHVLDANAHHNQVTLDANADAVLSLSTQQLGLDTQAANRVLAGPTSGAAAVPTFRALVAADIPALGGTPALTFTTSNAAGAASTYIRTDASLAIFDATAPTTIQPDDAAAAGSAAYAARRDHKHAIVTKAPGNQAIGDSATEGTATSFARSDHKHGMPSFATPSVSLGTAAAAGSAATLLRSDCTIVAFDATVPTTIQPDDAAAAGSATYAARRDHKHAIVCTAPSVVLGTVAAEGSATSFLRADCTIVAFDATAPTTIQPDDAAAAGSAAYAARRDHKHAIVCTAPSVVLGTVAAEGSATSFLRADCTIVAFDATAPTTIQPDDAAAAGSAAYAARRDHKHAIVAAAATTLTVATTNAEGSSTSFARADHTHAITTSSNPGTAASILATDASGYLQLVRLGIATTPSYPLHVIGEARLDGDLTFVGAQSITTTADNLTLAPAGDITINPTGNDVLPYTNYDINLGSLAKKYLTLHAAELWVETLVAQDTIATIGGRILVGPTTTLTSDLGTGDTTIYVKHNQMAVGDRVYLEADGKVEFMAITAGPSGTGPYSYTVTRNLDGTGANQWYAGDAVFNTGAAGDGFIDLYSIRGVKSATQYGPTIVGNVRNSATYNDWTEAWAIGNLNGLYGYGADTYGVGLGKYSVADYVTIDPTNGIRFLDAADVVQAQLNGSVWTLGRVAASYSNVQITAGAVKLRTNDVTHLELTTAGTFWAGDTSTSERIQWDTTNGLRIYDANNAVVFSSSPSGATWLSTLAISNALGDILFSQADGLLLLGPSCAITPTSWTSTRGQVATLSGAFHQAAGPWAQSRALVVEQQTTNLWTNPSAYIDTTNVSFGWVSGSAGSRVTNFYEARLGTGFSVYRSTGAGSGQLTIYHNANMAVAYGTPATGSCLIKGFGATVGATARIRLAMYNSSSTFLGMVEGNDFVVPANAQRVQQSFTITDPNTVYAKLVVLIGSIIAESAANYVYFSEFQLEATAYATSYCDGSLGTGYTWTGTPHASTSARTATSVTFTPQGLIDLGSGSLSIWFQLPYNAGTSGLPSSRGLFMWWDSWNTESFYIAFNADQSSLALYSYTGGVSQVAMSASLSGSKAGEWHNITVTTETNSVKLYLDGILKATDTSYSAPAITSTTARLGYVTAQFGGAIAEFASFDRVLTAEEVATLYAQGKPLADMGALRRPGIYVLDGDFDLRSSQTGARVQIDATGIKTYNASSVQTAQILNDGSGWFGSSTAFTWTTAGAVTATGITVQSAASGGRVAISTNGVTGYSSAAQTFALQTDGDFFIGSNIAAAATTSMVMFANAQTYNSESVGAGDVLLGDNSAGKINLLWDVSEGDVVLRRGTSARITLDGSADTVQIGQAAASQNNVLISSGALQLRTNTTVNAEITATGELILGDDGGAQDWISISSANGIRLYGNNVLLGQWTTAGKVILGEVANSKSRVEVDAGALNFITRSGAGVDATNISLSAAGVILIGQAAASQNNIQISSGAISIRNNATERIGITAAGVLTIKDSSGNAVLTFDASAGAEITKKLKMPGANSAIAIGTTPPTSASAGTGIWIDRTGIYGLSAGTYQAKLQATDGKIIAGAGNVTLDSNGITVTGALSSTGPNKYKIAYDGNTITELYFDEIPSNLYYTHLKCTAPSGKTANVELKTIDGNATANTLLLYNGGLALASGLLQTNGQISTNAGTNYWTLAGYTATAPSATGYVTITINGTTYKLLAST